MSVEEDIERLGVLVRELQSHQRGNVWHLVGDVGEPAFQNGWLNYDARTARFRKVGELVHMVGYIKSGTVGNVNALTLPVGYRPHLDQSFVVAANNAFGQVDVLTNGDVRVVAGSNVWVGLNIAFVVV